MSFKDLLICHYDEFENSVTRLYRDFDASPAFRDYFLENPTNAISKSMFPDLAPLSQADISAGNKLLYSLLSNPKFAQWAKRFEHQLYDSLKFAEASDDPEVLKQVVARIDKKKLYKDIVEGIQEFGDVESLSAILGRPRSPAGTEVGKVASMPHLDVAVEIEILIYAVAVAAVFIIPVDVFFAPATAGVSRDDLHRISNVLAVELKRRATDERIGGRL